MVQHQAEEMPVGCEHCDLLLETNLRAANGLHYDYQPGDTICILAGQRSHLMLQNWQGTQARPLVFINAGGQVRFFNDDHYYGISIANMQHFKLLGNGDSTHAYGIVVDSVGQGNCLTLYDGCSDFEIAHLELTHAQFAGLVAKSEPNCEGTYNRGNYVMKNVSIHHNFIHHTHGEGIYIGSSFYSGKTLPCKDDSVTVFPHEIQHIDIAHNHICYTGWDGMQVAGATESCYIHHNHITYYGTRLNQYQNAGIQFGGGTTGACYNNYLAYGSGNGVDLFGLGNTFVCNNVIVEPGKNFFPDLLEKRAYGIFCTDATTLPGNRYVFAHNTIIRPKTDGIRMYCLQSRDNYIVNNLIVNPQGYHKYLHDGILNTKPDDAYIYTLKGVQATIAGNYTTLHLDEIQFQDPTHADYSLGSQSPLINAGVDLNADLREPYIQTDMQGRPRQIGPKVDVGAFEDSSYAAYQLADEEIFKQVKFYPNPVHDIATLRLPANPMKPMQIRIFNMAGQLVSQNSIETPERKLLLDHLAPNTYILILSSESSSHSLRFIKKD